MEFVRDPTDTDEYILTAHQIFEGCGLETTSSLRVDALMDRFAPFVKTNKAEFSILKTLLDPEECNPEINVSNLANALHQYTESHKTKMDLDESFNLRNGQGPHDADSGISTDGLQVLEDLQCELKEKEYIANQLRSQLDFTDRQHEETIAALTAERDSLKRHLNILREENATLSNVRRDYDEACERLCSSGVALDETKRELEGLKRRARLSRDQVATLEAEKISLQDLLSKSKDECHRINEMYASRQSALLEENETLKGQHADLATKLQDQDEFLQQVIKDKVLLEMELKDMLNRSNQTQLRLDRSIDVSYTDDQMLTALDSLNADSRFSTDNRILDEDSFMNALKDDIGRCTNMSLFDELRMSFSVSRLNLTGLNAHCEKCGLENSLVTEIKPSNDSDKDENRLKATETQTVSKIRLCADCVTETKKLTIATQTDIPYAECDKDEGTIASSETQTDRFDACINVNKKIMIDLETQTDSVIAIQKTDLGMQTDAIKNELYSGGDNAQSYTSCGNVARKLDFESSFQNIPYINEHTAQYQDIDVTQKHIEVQTEASMQNELCPSENNIQFLDAKDYTTTATQTVGEFVRKRPQFIKKAQKLLKLQNKLKYRFAETQTDEIEPCVNNNNAHCIKCLECANMNIYTAKLERDVRYANMEIKEMEDKIKKYEDNLSYLEALISQETGRNEILQSSIDKLNLKIEILESACETQREHINKYVSTETSCVQSQTEFDQASVSTQADVPCPDCVRTKATPPRGFRKIFWEPIKCLFQIFAVVCFVGAVCVLYGVSQRTWPHCRRERTATPWRWFDAQDIMDLLLRIEYTAEVPM